MNDAFLIAALMRVLANLSRGAEFGPKGQVIGSTLALAATAVERGAAGTVELKALKAQIEAMVSEGRAPTPLEFEALKARSDAAHAILQGVPATGEGEPAPTSDTDTPA